MLVPKPRAAVEDELDVPLCAPEAATQSWRGWWWLTTGLIVVLCGAGSLGIVNALPMEQWLSAQASAYRPLLGNPDPDPPPRAGSSGESFGAPSSTGRAQPGSGLVHVRYEIEGPAQAGPARFSNGPDHPDTEVPRIRLPWVKEFDVSGGFIPTISVQGVGESGITCRISINGVLVSSVTSDGENAVVVCTGYALN